MPQIKVYISRNQLWIQYAETLSSYAFNIVPPLRSRNKRISNPVGWLMRGTKREKTIQREQTYYIGEFDIEIIKLRKIFKKLWQE